MATGATDEPSAIFTHAICKTTDMQEDLKIEAMEITVTAVEKYQDSYESAARMVKDNLDQKFGAPFNVVIGEAFSYCVTYQEKSMMLLYTNGNVAALIWRTVSN